MRRLALAAAALAAVGWTLLLRRPRPELCPHCRAPLGTDGMCPSFEDLASAPQPDAGFDLDRPI